MIKIVTGDILNASEDIVCQQVNCRGVMSKGLGLKLRITYPEVYYTYLMHCQRNKYSKDMLGAVIYVNTRNNIIANIFGQYQYGDDKQHTVYDALTAGFKNINDRGGSVAIPYNIGCEQIEGGDWDIVYGIITDVFKNRNDVTIYK